MKVEKIIEMIGADFYTGVPDSQLRDLCDYLMERYGIDGKHHIIAANEGNSVALAAGYHLATGKIPVIYMQNSGEGNAINPLASLLNEKVYGIPCIFIIGWRGEPGVHDEPQHLYQGEITLQILDTMGVAYFVLEKETREQQAAAMMEQFRNSLKLGKQVAFVVKQGALEYDKRVHYANENSLLRETVLEHILNVSEGDPVVSTTGKTSRELFEIRERKKQGHSHDFLTVGSMGHSSSIALGIALQKRDTTVWCIDGDGAMLMHMGALAVIGSSKAANLVHILINNGAHESVGGMPTAAEHTDILGLARACGYEYAAVVEDIEKLDIELKKVKERRMLTLLEVRCAIGSRKDLGRPTISPQKNKEDFMEYMKVIGV